MLIIRVKNKNNKKEVTAFEQAQAFVFPPPYRNFLLKYGGGETPQTEFHSGKVNSDISHFFGFGEEAYTNYNHQIKTLAFSDFIKDAYLPIAGNSFGDHILLGIATTNEGAVFFRYHDRPKRYIKIAADFPAFVVLCKSTKVTPPRSIKERKRIVTAAGNAHIIPEAVPHWKREIRLAKKQGKQEELILD